LLSEVLWFEQLNDERNSTAAVTGPLAGDNPLGEQHGPASTATQSAPDGEREIMLEASMRVWKEL
jgi:hypothetical protein